MGRIKRLLLLVLASLFFIPIVGHASTDQPMETREDVLDFLKKAFQAQVSLSEEGRTEEEVLYILNPYFTDTYIKLFKDENIVEENGLQFTYGTDFAPYYIPFFQFSDRTQIEIQENRIYVYEFFKGENEGPVTYKDHYEAIIIKRDRTGAWKVSEYSYDFQPSVDIVSHKKENKKVLNTVYPVWSHPFQALLVSTLHHLRPSTSFFYKYITFGNE